uniref:ZP domain-containing protein n=1 Tax=Bursaphelenchus xylophilus TaxID=6326 RepID=A0A1I7RIZ0_BURXY
MDRAETSNRAVVFGPPDQHTIFVYCELFTGPPNSGVCGHYREQLCRGRVISAAVGFVIAVRNCRPIRDELMSSPSA